MMRIELGTVLRASGFVGGPLLILAAIALSSGSFAQDELEGAEPLPTVELPNITEPGPSPDPIAETIAIETTTPTTAVQDTPVDPLVSSDVPLPEPLEYTEPQVRPQPLPVEADVTVDEDLTVITNQPLSAPIAAMPSPGVVPNQGFGRRLPIHVVVDRAKVMRLAEPADTIIVGNPAIANVTLQDAETLVITAMGYGSTNLIVLNSDGEPFVDEVIVTERPSDSIISVYRGTQQFSYACAPQCTPTPTIGDNNDHFETTLKQTQERNAATLGAIAGAQGLE